MIGLFESISQRTLQPAQVERLLINLYAYRESLVRNAIQWAGQQNLLAYAIYPMLDFLGQLLGVNRLPAQGAVVTIQFTLQNPLAVSYTIPAGTLVATNDGLFQFATDVDLTIPAESTSGSVTATCTQAGAGANGYLTGQINTLLTGDVLISGVTNTDVTSGGSATETDEHLRTRIQAAPSEFSSAGPTGAYRFFTLSADPSIIDCQVTSPVPGTVKVYILTGPITIQPVIPPNNTGIAGGTLLDKVLAALNADTVRPLTDTVQVAAVNESDYVVNLLVTLYSDADPTSVEAAVLQALTDFAIALASRVKRDVVPSQIIGTVQDLNGVYEAVFASEDDWPGITTAVVAGAYIKPTVGNAGGYVYKCTTAGTTGGSEPSPWNQNVGQTQADGSAVWTNIGVEADVLLTAADGEWSNCSAIILSFVIGTEHS